MQFCTSYFLSLSSCFEEWPQKARHIFSSSFNDDVALKLFLIKTTFSNSHSFCALSWCQAISGIGSLPFMLFLVLIQSGSICLRCCLFNSSSCVIYSLHQVILRNALFLILNFEFHKLIEIAEVKHNNSKLNTASASSKISIKCINKHCSASFCCA